ncbi:MAG: hypothetical protein JHC52_12865, partial [Chthoniobacterales bacterium]|nr:hypothetical protein [Chthoniobacterales bacterium]
CHFQSISAAQPLTMAAQIPSIPWLMPGLTCFRAMESHRALSNLNLGNFASCFIRFRLLESRFHLSNYIPDFLEVEKRLLDRIPWDNYFLFTVSLSATASGGLRLGGEG